MVKAQGSTGSETTYVKGEDYDVYYSGDNLVVELIPTGDAYAAEELNVAYSKATPDSITATNVATGLEAIEHCMTTVGVIPDLICAPGYSCRDGHEGRRRGRHVPRQGRGRHRRQLFGRYHLQRSNLQKGGAGAGR